MEALLDMFISLDSMAGTILVVCLSAFCIAGIILVIVALVLVVREHRQHMYIMKELYPDLFEKKRRH